MSAFTVALGNLFHHFSTFEAGIRGLCRRGPPASQREHHNTEEQQHRPPAKIDVNSKRTLIDRFIANQSVHDQQQSEQRKHRPDRQSYVESHLALSFDMTQPSTKK